MTPTVIWLLVFACVIAAGTVLGGLAIVGGTKAAGGTMAPGKGMAAGFSATFVGAACYEILLLVLDKGTQPVINGAFFGALALAAVMSYIIVMKFSELEPSKVPLVWSGYAVIFLAALGIGRVKGWELREANGFFRGYESVWALNLIQPADAMATPEDAVKYYNQQYTALRNANEDTGLGKILTTPTHWDSKWFNDNYMTINEVGKSSDITGISSVAQDFKQIKMLVLAKTVHPIFGNIVKSAIDPDNPREAVVKMDSGEVVRLYKQGKNWKVRDFLGMRPLLMQEIHEYKEKNNALTDEDRKAAAENFQGYENETKRLCEKVGIDYEPFDPNMEEKEESAKGGKSATGYAKLDAAVKRGQRGGLVDLTKETPIPQGAAATPAVAAVDVSNKRPRMQVAQAASPLPTPASAAIPGTMPTAAPPAGIPPQLPLTAPGGAAAPGAAATPASSIGAALGAIIPTPAPVAIASPTFLDNVPVSSLWALYWPAISKIDAGDTRGVKEFINCISADDANWLRSSAPLLAAMIDPSLTPQVANGSLLPDTAQLVVLRAMLRNMPKNPNDKIETFLKVQPGQNLAAGVAKFTETGPTGTQTYTTLLTQEGGRWVLAYPFFIRSFVYAPQLAWFKASQHMPLGVDEALFLQGGFPAMQQRVQQIYQIVGFSGG